MKTLICASILLLTCGMVLACESYEKCLSGELEFVGGFDENGKPYGPRTYSEVNTLRAIAFKLEEIRSDQKIYHNFQANQQTEAILHFSKKLDELSKKLDQSESVDIDPKKGITVRKVKGSS